MIVVILFGLIFRTDIVRNRRSYEYRIKHEFMELTFPGYDVRFIAVNDGVDSANGFNEMSTLRNWFNDFYARDTSKKIRAVQRAKGERGERVGTTIPYGYMKDPKRGSKMLLRTF